MITILTVFQSPRLDYVVDTIFKEWLELDYKIVSTSEQIHDDSCCIAYGSSNVPSSINVFNEGLLSESTLRSRLPEVSEHEAFPVIFMGSEKDGFDLPFDIFSAVFFCLTRYEEYITTQRDKHGRFEAENSIFYGHHRIPYLDRWVLALENLIGEKLPNYRRKRSIRWLSTLDMDIAFAYKGRSFARMLGASGKDLLNLRFDRLKERVSVLFAHSDDPFDTYDLFLSDDGAASKRLFIPVGDRSTFDNNLSAQNDSMRLHIAALGKKVDIGLHPSYQSLGNKEMIEIEKTTLERAMDGQITESRQHFLRFSIPDTFQFLQSIGIEREYSMGFHDEVGFRSGTAYRHLFYDLRNDVELSLELVPLIAMDSAMKNYLKLTPAQAIDALRRLLLELKTTGGTITTVWHNHSLSETEDWKGWRSVFESIPDIVRSHR